ncbi:MAG: hypothetical protein IKU30_02210 [Clostridia bacterium]|nr:hypothetical protein [Clostridia bacterium]
MKQLIEKIKEKFKKLDIGTVLRTVLFYLSLANEIVAIIGKTTYAQAEWYQWLSVSLLAVTAIIAWWYNNDYTEMATIARDIFDALKDGVIEKDEIKHILEKIAQKKIEIKEEEHTEEQHEEHTEEHTEEPKEEPVEEKPIEEKPVETSGFPVLIETRNATATEHPATVENGEKFHVEIKADEGFGWREGYGYACVMGSEQQKVVIKGNTLVIDIEAVTGKITIFAVAQ